MKVARTLLALILGPGALLCHAQSTAPRSTPRTFEVAAIKPNDVGGEARRASSAPGGVFTATNVNLKQLISRAYGVPEAQIEGGPGWIDTQAFDVEAKADTPLEMSREEMRPCLQALLAERFRLTIHRETKQGSVYSLEVAKNGPKFAEHSGPGRPSMGASSESTKVVIMGTKVPVARLAEYLSGRVGRLVIDNTGLKGEYDLKVEWSTDEATAAGGPSLFAALQEQLG